ncbi:MAG: hypothetical protein KC475_01380 [Cyanobacteria bacterium HKST-UBA03]|nr:hypothetical protein [Cyanobacteria bacterium HKST-UBA03]
MQGIAQLRNITAGTNALRQMEAGRQRAAEQQTTPFMSNPFLTQGVDGVEAITAVARGAKQPPAGGPDVGINYLAPNMTNGVAKTFGGFSRVASDGPQGLNIFA